MSKPTNRGPPLAICPKARDFHDDPNKSFWQAVDLFDLTGRPQAVSDQAG
jgi:hypothetical protein